jgi:hypothetical protein
MLTPFRFFTHFHTKQKILSRKFQQFLHQKKNHIREVQIWVCKFFWFSFFCFFSWVHVTACIVCLFWVWDQKTLLEAEVEKASCFGCEIKREKLACLGRGVKDCKQAGMEKASYFWV